MAHPWSKFDPEHTEESIGARIRRSYRSLTSDAAKGKWLFGVTNIVATVLVPIAVAYCVNLMTSGDNTKEDVGRIALGGVALVQAVLLIGILVGPSTPANVVQDLDEIAANRDGWIEHAKSLDHVGGVFSTAADCSASAAQIAINVLLERDDRGEQPGVPAALEEILAPYIELRHEALNFARARGRYTFTVFELDQEEEALTPIFSHHDDGIVSRGRRLPVARSHAGQAVITQDTKITDDARLAKEFLDVLDLEDRQNYLSMASFPIFAKGEVFGACTISCDVPSQFGIDGANAIFDTLGGIISLYLSSRGSDSEVQDQSVQAQGTPSGGDSSV